MRGGRRWCGDEVKCVSVGMSKEDAKETVTKATAEAAAKKIREQLERADRGQPGSAISTTGFKARLL